jgi:heme exporter protein B
MWRAVKLFIAKDLRLEIRNRYAISGIVLYLLSAVFVLYISFVEVDDQLWNNLFWLIMLFVAINSLTKSFLHESGRQQLYHYTIADPISIFISKVLYNTLLLWLLALLCFVLMSVIFQNPVHDPLRFTVGAALGSLGLSLALTFISLIALQTRQSHTIMAVLGFPVLIPILAMSVRTTWNAIERSPQEGWQNMSILLAVNLILLAVGLLLFPIIWRN